MSRPSTLDLPEPRRVTEDPFWAMQVAGALPFALLLLGGLDAVRYAVAGPPFLSGPSRSTSSMQLVSPSSLPGCRLRSWRSSRA
jgi:hypothetical protein